MSSTGKIVKRKLSDEVFDRLYDLIRSGGYAPGDTLPSERELMESLGVGRPAIREAMQSLERQGLIAIHHGQRPRVLQPTASGLLSQIDLTARHMLMQSPESLEHLKEARSFFEVGMAQRAAELADAADVARLAALLERQRRALEENCEAFIAADMAFHRGIAAITRNPIYAATSEAMLGWLARFHSKVLHWEGNEQTTLAEHEGILRAIEAHDPAAAGQRMGDHLRRSRVAYQNTAGEALPT
ncbi:HTH-type transcriptional regulator LutR [Azoarcus sp. Aa7]|nr:HTH-type transcriptional regulator LutR [Azoarcus sp. Aa7]